MKKIGVFLAAAALGALPLSAEAFGCHLGGGRAGMGSHGFNRPAFGQNFRGLSRSNGFAFRHDGRFDRRAFARNDRFFHRHHRFFHSDFAFFGFGFPYPYYPYYPGPYPYDLYYPYPYYPY